MEHHSADGKLINKTGDGSYDYYNCGGCTGYLPHAVCSTVSGGTQTTSFSYDGNGNAYWRYENGHLYLQSWDGDNRLTGVQEKSTSDWSANNGAATTFTYDADGSRVKRVGSGGTTFYIGDRSELIPGVKWTQYFSFNGQRVAVRDGGAGPVSWLQGDHFGSASMTTDANGAKTSEYCYTPYGGIDFAQARYYDSVIGRWLSADVNYDGGLEDPQGLNRYSYVKGHVMNAIDPTGKQCLISFLYPPPTVVMDTNVTPAVNAQDSVKATLEPQPTATGTPVSPSPAATQQAKATPTQTATATRALETVTVYRMVRPDKISPSSFGYDDKSDVEPRCGISVYEELPPGAICFPMQVIYKGPKEPGRVGVIADPKLQDMGAAAMHTPLAGGLPGAKGHWSIVLQSPITDERKVALKKQLSDTAKQHFKGLKSQ